MKINMEMIANEYYEVTVSLWMSTVAHAYFSMLYKSYDEAIKFYKLKDLQLLMIIKYAQLCYILSHGHIKLNWKN